jgi:hypothetical protein
VRVQVIPQTPIVRAPPSFGLHEQVGDRLWQDYAMTGRSMLPVPQGEHRVVVSRGYEWELSDTTVTVTAGQTSPIAAALQRTVDSTGVMCADFHIHSYYSADSNDPVEAKVKGAIADGLEIPVSSEHEWVFDFQPVVAALGMTKWAFGMPSEELTTFAWGHFGLIPLFPRPELANNGAIDWARKTPIDVFAVVNALPEKPAIIVNHPTGGSFNAYFSKSGFDRAMASGTPGFYSDDYAAIEVLNGSDFASNVERRLDWYSILSAGRTKWMVGSSDSHDQRRDFVGYPRTCLRFGHDDPTRLTPEIVRDVLRSGAAVPSAGIFMTVEGPGGIGPGGTATAGSYRVVVQTPSFTTADTLEIILDGETIETRPLGAPIGPGPGKRWEITVDVQPRQSRARHWVVFHAKGPGDLAPLWPGAKPFAVSNPIFF